MEVFFSILIIIAMVTSFHPLKEQPREELILDASSVGIENLQVRENTTPLSYYLEKNLVKQQHDYSCGSAALATILNYYLGEDLTEDEVIQGLFQYGDMTQIERRRAFSLLDMKRFVGALGYNVAGYTAEIDDLKTLGMPGIIPINVFQYKHFVVFKGVYNGHVFVGDPFLGNMSYTMDMFRDVWYRNIILLVSNGGNELDNLILTDDDLRLVDIEMVQKQADEIDRDSIIAEQRNFLETTGKVVFIDNN